MALDAIRPDAPAIHVPGFLNGEVAARMAEAVARVNFRPYSVTESSSAGAAYYFGANLYDTRPDVDGDPDYSPYFQRAARDRRALKRIMTDRGLPDPLDDIFLPVLAATHDGRVGLAQQPDGSTFCAPVVRSTANGIHHHTDNGPLEAPELAIAAITKQRSMLVFLDAPGDGTGALEVFHKRPTSYDNSHHRHPRLRLHARCGRKNPCHDDRSRTGPRCWPDACSAAVSCVGAPGLIERPWSAPRWTPTPDRVGHPLVAVGLPVNWRTRPVRGQQPAVAVGHSDRPEQVAGGEQDHPEDDAPADSGAAIAPGGRHPARMNGTDVRRRTSYQVTIAGMIGLIPSSRP